MRSHGWLVDKKKIDKNITCTDVILIFLHGNTVFAFVVQSVSVPQLLFGLIAQIIVEVGRVQACH